MECVSGRAFLWKLDLELARSYVYYNTNSCPPAGRRTFAGTSVQAWQQLSGANVMTYYVVYIFEMANLTGNIGLVSSGIQYAIFIIGTAATFFFIDKTGRRPLLVRL